MTRPRRNHSPAFKARIAYADLREFELGPGRGFQHYSRASSFDTAIKNPTVRHSGLADMLSSTLGAES